MLKLTRVVPSVWGGGGAWVQRDPIVHSHQIGSLYLPSLQWAGPYC